MSLLECEAEAEIYFRDNWVSTAIQFPDRDFNYDGLDTFISLKMSPVLNTQIGFDGTISGRQSLDALSVVYCYHKTEKRALALADDVMTFFNGVQLPKDIYVHIAQPTGAIPLDNGFYEVKLNFDIKQYS